MSDHDASEDLLARLGYRSGEELLAEGMDALRLKYPDASIETPQPFRDGEPVPLENLTAAEAEEVLSVIERVLQMSGD